MNLQSFTRISKAIPGKTAGLTSFLSAIFLHLAAATSVSAEEYLYQCDDLEIKSPLTSIGIQLYQGRDGWFFRRSSDLENLFDVPEDSLMSLQRVNEALAYRNIHLILMPMLPRGIIGRDYIPNDGLLYDMIYDPDFAADMFSGHLNTIREAGIDTLDLNQVIDESRDTGRSYFSFARDFHWRPEGAREVARALAAKVNRLFPENETPVQFETQLSGENVTISGNYLKTLNEVCQDKIPPEVIETYVTKRSLDSLDALFADDDKGEEGEFLHIVGTSFTDEKLYYNFPGFLRQFLQRDVASFSIAGGGFTTAIYSWAQKDRGLAQQPKVVLWEYTDSKNVVQYGQYIEQHIVPAIFGECSGVNRVAEAEFDRAGETDFVLEDVDGDASNHYLSYAFTNAALTGFQFEFRYEDGTSHSSHFENPENTSGLRKVFQALPERTSQLPTQVRLTLDDDLTSAGKVQLCRYPERAFSRHLISN